MAAYSWARSFFSCRSPKNAGSLDGFQVFGTKAAGKAAVQMGVDNFDGCYRPVQSRIRLRRAVTRWILTIDAYLDSRPITHSTTSGSLFLYRVAASLGCALSRLHRAYDTSALDRVHAIRSIRAGVSGRYPFIPPVGQSVL